MTDLNKILTNYSAIDSKEVLTNGKDQKDSDQFNWESQFATLASPQTHRAINWKNEYPYIPEKLRVHNNLPIGHEAKVDNKVIYHATEINQNGRSVSGNTGTDNL